MKSKKLFSYEMNLGFTLVELMIVVAIISVLAAIAIPTYSKYVKKSRTAEATGNLGAIAIYEETFFSENDIYVTAAANPAIVPNPSNPGGRAKPDSSIAGWSLLGRVLPNSAPLYFQYETVAGAYDSGGTAVTGGTGNLKANNIAPSMGGAACTTVGLGTGNITATALGIPTDKSSSWFFATAIADQDGDKTCSLFIKVIDRPDLVVEEDIE